MICEHEPLDVKKLLEIPEEFTYSMITISNTTSSKTIELQICRKCNAVYYDGVKG